MINRTWRNGFYTASVAAQQSDAPTQAMRVGAALYTGNRLLSIGFNLYTKTHPQYEVRNKKETWGVTIHAELAAIIKRRHYDKKNNLILYVYRELADGTPGCSRPCTQCQEAIRLAGIKRVRFYDEHGKAKEYKT